MIEATGRRGSSTLWRRFYCANACLFALYAVSNIMSSRVPSLTRFDATRDASARVVVDCHRDENDDDETGVADGDSNNNKTGVADGDGDEEEDVGLIVPEAIGLVVPEEDDVVVDDAAVGGLAWLMSFPNSGTSYTMRVVREVSHARVAINYGAENERLGFASVPVYPSRSREGPYLLNEPYRYTPLRANGSYVLTKTHCGARCLRCRPSLWLERTASFSVKCRTANGWVVSSSSTTRVPLLERVETTVYANDLVERAVHLFRDPFDNVVSRFHLDHNEHVEKGDDAWTARFPRAPEGFRAWCRDMNAMDRKRDKGSVFPERLRPFFKPSNNDDERSFYLPCRSEFARYAHWHNLAFRVVEALGVPEHVLHFVDYREDLEGTVDSLLDFLGLERRETTSTEFRWSNYSDYYHAEQREALWELVRAMATDRTWKELERYRR